MWVSLVNNINAWSPRGILDSIRLELIAKGFNSELMLIPKEKRNAVLAVQDLPMRDEHKEKLKRHWGKLDKDFRF